VLLYRLDVEQRAPQAWQALQKLEGRITESDMIAMNAAAELEGKSFSAIAQAFLTQGKAAQAQRTGFVGKLLDENLWRLTRQHIMLVAFSVSLAALVGIPLGIVAAFVAPLRHAVMAIVGVLQTVPSLALLAMLIPVLGTIGVLPALIALFLYALLPIVRNTCTGLGQVPAGLRMAALALGLKPIQRLVHIDLPLSLPFILAGVKTAAVMSVGTATIAAFIGAGGYGERIAIGLALNDNDMLLAGAIPAAAMALLTQLLFELAERALQKGRGVAL
jgi:osmoprotectant transport system permease protein